MNSFQLKNYIENDGLKENFLLLYNDFASPKERFIKSVDEFVKLYGERDELRLYSAPGRTEVGGNHTDHQHGCVLAGSVDLDVIAVVAKNNDNTVRIKSEGYDMDVVDLNDLEIKENEFGKAISLIRGMCAIMKENGYNISGFDAYTTSNVLKGSGLSSSAAFEVLIGVIVSNLSEKTLNPVEIAKFSQKAENIYFGKPCGLMDQMASAVGGFTSIDFKDTECPIIKKVDFSISEHGHALCIVNTGGNHADLTQDYADITVGDREVANYFGKDYLREVDENDFFANLKDMRTKISDRSILCALHYFADNKRAIAQADALMNDDFIKFLDLINESGNSSFKYLQNVFSVRFPKEQGLSLAIALTEKYLAGKGGHRVHGGGFAGTIQAFVPFDMLDGYKSMIESVFGEGNCYVLNIRPVGGFVFEI